MSAWNLGDKIDYWAVNLLMAVGVIQISATSLTLVSLKYKSGEDDYYMA